jgi:hypothetical protein
MLSVALPQGEKSPLLNGFVGTRYREVKVLHLTGTRGARGSVVVKALCYRPEGRGCDTR